MISRLELTVTALAVRVDRMLRAELQLQLEDSVFWTDSTSVLKYIKNEDKRFHTFVGNRISTIRDATNMSQWRHVSSKMNPADGASRGMKVDALLTGSSSVERLTFLWKPEEQYAQQQRFKEEIDTL